MNLNYRGKNKKPWISRLRYQLLGGLIAAIFLPFLVKTRDLNVGSLLEQDINTLVGAAIAVTIGLFVMRRLTNYPSITAGAYVVISFSLSYLAIMGVFFVFRLEYSNSVFILSYGFSLFWFVAVYFYIKRQMKIRYALIPGGNVERLLQIKDIEWTVLESPDDYQSNFGSVVVDLRHSHDPSWERFIAECTLNGVPVFHSKQVTEFLTGKVDIEFLSENTFGSLLPGMIYQRLKRAADTILAVLILPLVLLIVAIAGIAILIFTGRPIFFTQQRMGYQGVPFKVIKLRTMKNSKVDQAESGALNDPKSEDDDLLIKKAMTGENDERITRLGRHLRKYRIDELPQIINIIRGDMSWIGPRPEAIVLSELYEKKLPFYRYRHIVRPGISGWAQVNQGHVSDVEQVNEKLHYDFFYIKNLSAWLDFLIIVKTVWIVVTGFGSK